MTIDYSAIKATHILLVSLSLLLFCLRGYWALIDQLHLRGYWVKLLPAAIDTLLLASGLVLLLLSGFSPLNQSWLALKLLLLLGYIVLGALALNYGPRSARPWLLIGSISVVILMIFLARLKPSIW